MRVQSVVLLFLYIQQVMKFKLDARKENLFPLLPYSGFCEFKLAYILIYHGIIS